MSRRPVAEAAASLHLGEVEGKAVVVVPTMALVLLVMVRVQMMMEEERGRLFLLLVHQAHHLSFYNLINPIWFSIRVP
jgi:reverse gyrase